MVDNYDISEILFAQWPPWVFFVQLPVQLCKLFLGILGVFNMESFSDFLFSSTLDLQCNGCCHEINETLDSNIKKP